METALRTWSWLSLSVGLPLLLGIAGPAAAAEPDKPEVKRILFGPKDDPKAEEKCIVLEIEGKKRRVVVPATVVMTKGPLEQLLTRTNTKEHEAVLAADIDARDLHAALLASGAVAGRPVSFSPVYRAATGQRIKVTLQYLNKGKLVSVPGQQWVRDLQGKKVLDAEWVFTGSKLVPNPFQDRKPIFLANEGDIICISNFESALLDLTIKSSKTASELAFEANAEIIPPMGTRVSVVLEPITGSADPKK